MPLPDPRESRAVLIGTARYRNLPHLPAVEANLKRLRTLFTAPDLWGLPADHCKVLLDPENPVEVLRAVHEAAKSATDTLVVYYAGHGLRDPETDELFLALPDSAKDSLFTSLRYDDVRREITQTAARVPGKVVILDCCYSGAAMRGSMGDSADIADQARIEGTYLMTASASTVVALAPEGEDFTAFTGEIVNVVERGIPDGPELLNMEKLYWQVRAELESKRRPVPQQRAGNSGGMIALVRNRRGSGGARETEPAPRLLPEAPAGLESGMVLSPHELMARIDSLREQEQAQIADQLLTAVATRRDPQEVAALLDYLGRADRADDREKVFRAAAGGEAGHTVHLVDALREIDLPGDVDFVLAAAAGASAQEIAVLAQKLSENGDPAAAMLLIDSAMAGRTAADSVISLVGALWAAGLADEVSRTLQSTAVRLSSPETLSLAQALGGAGRTELALTLYMSVLDTVVGQSEEDIATLVRAAHDSGHPQDATQIVEAAAATRTTARGGFTLATALWAAGLDADADLVLGNAATRLSDADLADLARELRLADRAEAALHLYQRAAGHRSAVSTIGFADALRDSGRPLDGNKLLAGSVSWPPSGAADLMAELLRRERRADAARVLAAQMTRPTAELADFADRLLQLKVPEPAEQVVVDVLQRGDTTDALELAFASHRAGLGGLVDRCIAALVQNMPQGADALVAALPGLDEPTASAILRAATKLPASAAVLLAKKFFLAGQQDASATIVEAVPGGTVSTIVTEFQAQDWTEGIRVFVRAKANIPLAELVQEYRSLMKAEKHEKATFLLDAVAIGRPADEIPAVLKELSSALGPTSAGRVIQTAAAQRPPADVAAIVDIMNLTRGGSKTCQRLLEVSATRTPAEVRAVEQALRAKMLHKYADSLRELAGRRRQ